MEGHATKRRRVYSLEPTKLLHASFPRKYVNHLVPALQNIKMEQISSSDHEKDNCEFKQIVRYEVNMALALSAQGFAWSHALKDKLQSGVNEEKIHLLPQKGTCMIEEINVHHDSLPMPQLQKPPVYTKLCPNQNLKLKTIKEAAKDSEEDEEKHITRRLNFLRNLLPGGNAMGVDEMLKEVGSYLVCLELQVNILRCLVEKH